LCATAVLCLRRWAGMACLVTSACMTCWDSPKLPRVPVPCALISMSTSMSICNASSLHSPFVSSPRCGKRMHHAQSSRVDTTLPLASPTCICTEAMANNHPLPSVPAPYTNLRTAAKTYVPLMHTSCNTSATPRKPHACAAVWRFPERTDSQLSSKGIQKSTKAQRSAPHSTRKKICFPASSQDCTRMGSACRHRLSRAFPPQA
jgi:hypothetical protein